NREQQQRAEQRPEIAEDRPEVALSELRDRDQVEQVKKSMPAPTQGRWALDVSQLQLGRLGAHRPSPSSVLAFNSASTRTTPVPESGSPKTTKSGSFMGCTARSPGLRLRATQQVIT